MDSSDYRLSPPHLSRLQDSLQACRSRYLQNELAEVVSLEDEGLNGHFSTTAQGFGSMPMRSLTADRIRCLQPR